MIQDFHNQLFERIKTIQELKEVFYAIPTTAKKYPIAWVRFDSFSAAYVGNVEINQVYTYIISLANLIEKTERNEAYIKQEQLTDTVVESIDGFLFSSAYQAEASNVVIIEDTEREQPMLISRITIEVPLLLAQG